MNWTEKSQITKEYLIAYHKESGFSVLDENDKDASMAFNGAILYAETVFTNRLMLGGHYQDNQEKKTAILDHLHAINQILKAPV